MKRISIPSLPLGSLLFISLVSGSAVAEPRASEPDDGGLETDDAPAVRLGSASGSYDLRSRADDQIVMPGGMYTLGGTMTFLTAPESPFSADDEIRFTDVVLLGFGARYGIKDRAEIAASVTVLPKQPSFTDEFIWQSASISSRIGFKKRYAGWASVSAGPTFGADGMWGAGAFGLEAQKPIHRTIIFTGNAGANTVGLFPDGDAGKMRDAAWFTEVTAGGEIIFRVPRGEAAGWVGTNFHFPVAELSESSMLDIDPQTRANFHVGAVLSAIENWDLSLQIGIVDRGDIKDPTTTLPILTGGFDQTHIIFGVTRRFKQENPRRPPMVHIGY